MKYINKNINKEKKSFNQNKKLKLLNTILKGKKIKIFLFKIFLYQQKE